MALNFDLDEEHQLLRDTVRQFALEKVAPVAEELDRESRFPYGLVSEMADLLYHLSVLLVDEGIGWEAVYEELEGRR